LWSYRGYQGSHMSDPSLILWFIHDSSNYEAPHCCCGNTKQVTAVSLHNLYNSSWFIWSYTIDAVQKVFKKNKENYRICYFFVSVSKPISLDTTSTGDIFLHCVLFPSLLSEDLKVHNPRCVVEITMCGMCVYV
jgi:hypothetical protein